MKLKLRNEYSMRYNEITIICMWYWLTNTIHGKPIKHYVTKVTRNKVREIIIKIKIIIDISIKHSKFNMWYNKNRKKNDINRGRNYQSRSIYKLKM